MKRKSLWMRVVSLSLAMLLILPFEAMAQQEGGGLLPKLQQLTVDSFRPETLGNDLSAPAAQLVLIAALLLVGLLIAIVDHGDRKYWNAQAA